MTFDVNTTPLCGAWAKTKVPHCILEFELWDMAVAQEKRARLAEEKLRIALEALERISGNFEDHRAVADSAILEIEKVGK